MFMRNLIKSKIVFVLIAGTLFCSCGSTSESSSRDDNDVGNGSFKGESFKITKAFSEKVAKYEIYGDYSEGLAIVKNCGEMGYINKNGDLVIPCEFSDAYNFHENMAIVRRYISDRSVFEYGYIDNNGKLIVPYGYDDAHDFSEGLAAVKTNGKWGYINKSGEIIISCQFDDADEFHEGLAGVSNGYYCGFINTQGDIVIPFDYQEVGHFSEGLTWVKKYDKCGFVNKSGETVISSKYDFAGNFSDGLAYVAINDRRINCGSYIELKYSYGFINTQGELIIPFLYDGALGFSEGMALVSKEVMNDKIGLLDEKYGYINTNGEVIVPLIYTRVGGFSDGLGSVYNKQDDVEGFVNRKGEIVLELSGNISNKVTGDPATIIAGHFSEGLAVIRIREYSYKGAEYSGFLDKYGNTTLSEEILNFYGVKGLRAK